MLVKDLLSPILMELYKQRKEPVWWNPGPDNIAVGVGLHPLDTSTCCKTASNMHNNSHTGPIPSPRRSSPHSFWPQTCTQLPHQGFHLCCYPTTLHLTPSWQGCHRHTGIPSLAVGWAKGPDAGQAKIAPQAGSSPQATFCACTLPPLPPPQFTASSALHYPVQPGRIQTGEVSMYRGTDQFLIVAKI